MVTPLMEPRCMGHTAQGFMHQTAQSWNSIINHHIKSRTPYHAITLYHKLGDESMLLNGRSFVALLQVCTRQNDLNTGIDIHANVAKLGLLDRDLFVGSTLVDMYAKCGSLAKAQQVFDQLPFRGVVSWTALIAGYAERGRSKDALMCYEQMELEGISPNVVTFGCSLKACGSMGAIDRGQQIHAEIERLGLLENDLFIGSALIDMYAKCGLLAKSQQVFDKLLFRDVVSWTALISGYSEHDGGEEALNCYNQMQLEGVSPNAITFVCSLKACSSIGACSKGQEIHAEIERRGMLGKELVIGNTLIDMYTKFGLLSMAQKVFDKLPVRDVVSWTALIAGYAEHTHGEEALKCFEQMQINGISPNNVTFLCSLKACGSIEGQFGVGDLLVDIENKVLFERDLCVGNTLVNVYAKCGSLARAQIVFDKLPRQDVVSWTALIAGYAEHGQGEKALECFEKMQSKGIVPNTITVICSLKACGSICASIMGQKIHADIKCHGLLGQNVMVGNSLVDMYARCGLITLAKQVFDELPTRDVVTWAALITGYVEHERGEEALKLYEQMQLDGIYPDAITFICSVKACCLIGAIEKGVEIHSEIERQGLVEQNLAIGNTLIDMYAKCGSLAKAQQVIEKLHMRDVVSWNALLAGYAQCGRSDNCFLIFDRMLGEGIGPDLVTFLAVLSACSRTGLFCKSETYLDVMSKDFGLVPTLEHHTCVLDILGRAGKLDKAVEMLKKIPSSPNHVVWHILLEASRYSGNLQLGKEAFKHALYLNANDAMAYIVMSHIYAGKDLLNGNRDGYQNEDGDGDRNWNGDGMRMEMGTGTRTVIGRKSIRERINV